MENKIYFTSYSPNRILGCADILGFVRDHFSQQGEFGTKESGMVARISTRENGRVVRCALGALMTPRAVSHERSEANIYQFEDRTIEEIHCQFNWYQCSLISINWAAHPQDKAAQFRHFLSTIELAHNSCANSQMGETAEDRKERFSRFQSIISEAEEILRKAASTQGIEARKDFDHVESIIKAAMNYAASI